MGVLELIASAINRRDDEPNKALAKEIILTQRKEWVNELVVNLKNKDKNIQSDCIKVLYEIGLGVSAELIAPYYKEFADLLSSKNNRLVWGAMIAIDTICLEKHKEVFSILPQLTSAIEKGSVITIDCGVGILAKFSTFKQYSDVTFPLLMNQLRRCPVKQLPMYAEKSEIAVNSANSEQFFELLEDRMREIEKDSQRTRINKIIKRIRN
jgi:hypothetical protein